MTINSFYWFSLKHEKFGRTKEVFIQIEELYEKLIPLIQLQTKVDFSFPEKYAKSESAKVC